MIYIGLDYEGRPMSIVSAADGKSAHAYWQGKGTLPHKTVTFDMNKDRENEQMGYVTPILTTKIKNIHRHDVPTGGVKILKVVNNG